MLKLWAKNFNFCPGAILILIKLELFHIFLVSKKADNSSRNLPEGYINRQSHKIYIWLFSFSTKTMIKTSQKFIQRFLIIYILSTFLVVIYSIKKTRNIKTKKPQNNNFLSTTLADSFRRRRRDFCFGYFNLLNDVKYYRNLIVWLIPETYKVSSQKIEQWNTNYTYFVNLI